MAPKKGKKVNLSEFLADETIGGSWADEMDSLPTGPSGDPSAGAGGLGGSILTQGGRGGYGDRANRGPDSYQSDRPVRAEVPIPTAPPFTAFVGNLTFETNEGDLESFFNGLPTVSIRVVVDQMDKKPKGFGYVEFTTLPSLISALELNGSDLSGRAVRISVAEAPKNREGRADEEISWTRQGPLAPLAGGNGGGRSGGYGNDRPRDGGFGNSVGPGGEEVVRDGPIRGGKFVASSPSEMMGSRRSSGFERNSVSNQGGQQGGFTRDRDLSGGAGPVEEVIRDGPIRGGKFVPTPERTERASSFGGSGDRRGSSQQFNGGGNEKGTGFVPAHAVTEPSRADEEKTWTRNGPLAPVVNARSNSFGGGAPRTPPSGESSPAPVARQRLQLSARSTAPSSGASSPTSNSSPLPSGTTSSKPSPFGAAKPIDSAERDRLAEEKHAKEREIVQAKLAAEKERREKEPVVEKILLRKDSSSTTTTTSSSSPFGAATPVDVTEREKEVAEKLAKSSAKAVEKKKVVIPAVVTESTTIVAPVVKEPSKAPTAALRKEGFSYSSIAVAKVTPVVVAAEESK